MNIARRACVINPRTGKSFTRHLYAQANLRVTEYVTMHDGSTAPRRLAQERFHERIKRMMDAIRTVLELREERDDDGRSD